MSGPKTYGLEFEVEFIALDIFVVMKNVWICIVIKLLIIYMFLLSEMLTYCYV